MPTMNHIEKLDYILPLIQDYLVNKKAFYNLRITFSDDETINIYLNEMHLDNIPFNDVKNTSLLYQILDSLIALNIGASDDK